MRIILLSLVIALVAGCAQIEDKGQKVFEVVSFSQGKMMETERGWAIYKQGEDMTFQENGTCIFNGSEYPCMWHGYVLKYDSAGQDISLDCLNRKSEPSNYGNPEELISQNSNQFSYSIPLKGVTNKFVNPQYVIRHREAATIFSTTECSVGGEVVLRFKQIFRFSTYATET